jgi:hypothetical protein
MADFSLSSASKTQVVDLRDVDLTDIDLSTPEPRRAAPPPLPPDVRDVGARATLEASEGAPATRPRPLAFYLGVLGACLAVSLFAGFAIAVSLRADGAAPAAPAATAAPLATGARVITVAPVEVR